jgi:hypothetical protein
VWARVYFYAIVVTLAGMALFASPARAFLSGRIKARMERPEMVRSRSEGGSDQVMFGVPIDAEAELQELVTEVRGEIERRRALGLQVPDVRALVKEKLAQMSGEVAAAVEGQAKKQEAKKEL